LIPKYLPDWRWLFDRTDSPWYPSVTLFRQATIGDWSATIAIVAEQLRARVLQVAA
jgi:hypothetical protein